MFTAAPTSNITQKYDVKCSRIIWLNHVTAYSKYVKINMTDVKQYPRLCLRSLQFKKTNTVKHMLQVYIRFVIQI